MKKEAKKRYCVGLNEIFKLLKINQLKMIIVCTNLESIPGEKGLDQVLLEILQECRAQNLPQIYCMNRYQLGSLAKFRG